MTEPEQIAAGLAAGAVVTVASDAAGQPATSTLLIGGGVGLFLLLVPRSRAAGAALLAASVAGAVATAKTADRPAGLGFRR